MTTVYVVTSGYYRDYHIVAIFGTEASALAFAKEVNGPDFDQETDEGEWDAYRVSPFVLGRP